MTHIPEIRISEKCLSAADERLSGIVHFQGDSDLFGDLID